MLKDVGDKEYNAVCRFYFREARLFSQSNYREWIDAMVDREIHYWLPVFEDRYKNDRKAPPAFPPSIYDDDFEDLDSRICQLETNLARRLDPAPRIRHLITNIEAFETDVAGDIHALSNFLVCRNRREREQSILVGGREDLLRMTNEGLRLVRRRINIPQRVVLDSDLYFMM
ncbi:Biphenyl dioxygenase subunit beta [Croceibacterium atlanticum]|uniref:Biphenyl dioxygenase subunit beta n=2 Tax=Croceibacterium atlanticum TaxID=1267766 RepID=A0A0F7KUI5_9SPHN|nr:Biphenyl dioxygenase subunit beta [Croceibacterium atlanticum]